MPVEDAVRSSETGAIGDCYSPRGCWESNKAPLEEQLVRLATEPSLAPDPKI